MRHPSVEELSSHLEGDGAVNDRQELKGHLSSCHHCAAALEELRILLGELGELADRPPEKELWRDIRRRLPANRPPATAHHRPRNTALAVAAALALAFFSWLFMRVSLEPPPQPPIAQPISRSPQSLAVADLLEAIREPQNDVDSGAAALQRAINEARTELDGQPDSPFLATHLLRLERQQWRLLRSRTQWTQAVAQRP